MAVAGDANRSSIDRKTKKKNTDQRPARERKKPEARAREKDSLRQPVNTTGRRTLGMGDAAPDGGHGGRLPGGGMRVRKRRRLGFRTWVAGLLQLPTRCFCLDLDLDLGRRRRRHHLACVRACGNGRGAAASCHRRSNWTVNVEPRNRAHGIVPARLARLRHAIRRMYASRKR